MSKSKIDRIAHRKLLAAGYAPAEKLDAAVARRAKRLKLALEKLAAKLAPQIAQERDPNRVEKIWGDAIEEAFAAVTPKPKSRGKRANK